MKIGKVFGKLAQDRRVERINHISENSADVVLAEGFYVPGNGARRLKTVSTAREAEAYIRSARKLPTARPGHYIGYNLMTGVAIEIANNTPLACNPASETYWSM